MKKGKSKVGKSGHVKSDFDSNVKQEVDTDVKADSDPDLKPDVDPDTDPNVKRDSDPDLKPDVDPDTDPNVKPEVDQDAKSDPDSKPDVKPEVSSETKKKSEPKPKVGGDREEDPVVEEIAENLGSKIRTPTHRWASNVPDVCLVEECVLGIDEAGRGPVLGPMVYGCCYVPRDRESALRKMGCMDSKMLTEGKREILFSQFSSSSPFAGWGVAVLPPSWICEAQLRRCKYNLNAMSHDAAMELIQGVIDAGVNLVEVFVDTVGEPTKYRDLIKSRFPRLAVRVEKKADATFPCVSAASIAAKVSRDAILQRWTFPESISVPPSGFGSGYTSDATTKNFLSNILDKVFGFPSFVRFSWSTVALLLRDNAYSVRWEDDEDEEDSGTKKKKKNEKPGGTAALSKYFSPATKRKANDDDDDNEDENEADPDAAKRRRLKEAETRHAERRHRFFTWRSLSLQRTLA